GARPGVLGRVPRRHRHRARRMRDAPGRRRLRAHRRRRDARRRLRRRDRTGCVAARVPHPRTHHRVRLPPRRAQLPGPLREPAAPRGAQPAGRRALFVRRPRRVGVDPGHGPEPGRGTGGGDGRRPGRTRGRCRRRRARGRAADFAGEAGSGAVTNLAEVLLAPARATPDAIALRAGTDAVTYRELESSAARVAGTLRSGGVEPGARVTIAGLHTIAFVASYLGALRAGAVAVPVNPHAPGPERG